MGGEKVPPLQAGRKRIGSPPRGRGKGIHGVSSASPMKDHPRVGGEKLNRRPWSCSRRGSPPRGRGKVINTDVPGHGLGITPAWAGKSTSCRAALRRCKDHPRVGGEKLHLHELALFVLGSPPRGRGKADPADQRPDQHGITPAWAGKREWEGLLGQDPGDHPRVGGEKGIGACTPMQRWGSPPRGRGKGLYGGAAGLIIGITPAWAGKRH